MLVPDTSLWKFSLKFDMHRWTGEEDCPVCGEGNKHEVRCADCGIKRYPCAEQGCYHFWAYDQPDGTTHEVIPLCGNKVPDAAVAMLDTVRVCCRCGHLLEEDKVADRCHYLCKERGTDKPAGTKELRLVRKIKAA